MTGSEKQKYVCSVTVFHYRVSHSEIQPDKARKENKKEENPDLWVAYLIAKLVLPLHYRILRNKLSLPAKAAIKPAPPCDANRAVCPVTTHDVQDSRLRVMSVRNMAREHSLWRDAASLINNRSTSSLYPRLLACQVENWLLLAPSINIKIPKMKWTQGH